MGRGCVQNIQQLAQPTVAVGRLLLQFRHYHRSLWWKISIRKDWGCSARTPQITKCSGLKW